MLDFSKIPNGPDIPEGYVDVIYGTAGFRGSTENPPGNLEHVAYRCGLLFASLPFISEAYFEKYSRSLSFNGSLGLGIVVTASHNPCSDNGIKLFSPSGRTLECVWEPIFTSFVNTRNSIQSALYEVFTSFGYKPKNLNLNILIGCDTRPSCSSLVSNLTLGIKAIYNLLNLTNSNVNFIGKITSPTISYLLSSGTTCVQDDEMYISFLSNSFNKIFDTLQDLGLVDLSHNLDKPEELYFDCSYGVGGYKIVRFFEIFRKLGIIPAVCNFHKFGKDRDLNYKCGASYVYSTSCFPEALKKSINVYLNKRFCCFDGDADRVLYYMPCDPLMNSSGEYTVQQLDGDRLLIVTLMLLWTFLVNYKKKLTIGIFQTRYSNGASVNYIDALIDRYTSENKNISWQHEYFNSGLKNAEKLAEKYDISLYYETNGHGNIVYNRNFYSKDCFQSLAGQSTNSHSPSSLHDLEISSLDTSMTNSTISSLSDFKDELSDTLLFDFLEIFFPSGDAILNSMFLELAFRVLKLSFHDCLNFYTDFPSSHFQYNLKPELKTLFSSSANETVLNEPKILQDKIDAKTRQFRFCRAFLRPSGTEPLLRIYVEGETHTIVENVQNYIVNEIDVFLANQRLSNHIHFK
ncbi:Phosphoacetylglucosamine mutase [Theileria parva strain Muguga]|uniref:Phosphoacetylglucosamine mutase n=1 Tax=Theileria parva TaxID=5875 RepID=Q4N3R3_THEPA|nr:Phosphoacetylglucosamine mutase [Theileria parva strain Muguga]EAN33210.1 Phosphoacetylglucosamine mutase [Theileria parva strain Muguga]|eukprot:XP_765493.1 N-acetylglucosamine-phosphate mutase [Theileria parva strain Muguga]